MDWFCRLLTVWLLGCCSLVGATSAGRGAEAWRGPQRDYRRIDEWARSSGYEVRWVRREEAVQLSSGASRVVLSMDSREAQVNGAQVWLSYPVARSGGNLYASQLDLKTTIKPLLTPARQRAGQKVLSVCLDAGHGGRDPGNQVGYSQEKKYTLLLAKEVRDQLSRAGLKVLMTRSTDRFVELPDRIEYANRRKADLFLCLHFNSAVNSRGTVKGSEVYCLAPAGASSTNSQRDNGGGDWYAGNRNNEQNILLAYLLQQSLVRKLNLEDRGVRRARFAVLRDAAMPAALIEGGFMSHPGEGKRIFSDDYRRQLARAIAEGVLAYKREVEK